MREHWRKLNARRGSPLEHLLFLCEHLQGNPVARLLEHWRAFSPEAGELSDDEIREFAEAGEPPIPMHLAWQLRLRDGRVRLTPHREPVAPPLRSGTIAGHAMRPAEEFAW